MKKIYILFSLYVLITIPVFSQVNFANISFDEALLRSKTTGKLVFLQFESTECRQCNEVAHKAFENKELGEILDQTFICMKITAEHADRVRVASLINKTEAGFGSMFIASDGSLIHQYPGSTTLIKTYYEHIDKALTKAGEGMRVSTLEKEYRAGNKNIGFLEMLMETKRTLNLGTDSLLDDYITIIPADSLKSVRTLLFIAGMAPVIDSKADVQLRKNYSVFISAWNSSSLPVRVATNNRIVYKSMQKAIREKNEIYAYKVAEFRKRTYESNPVSAQRAYDHEMIGYYLGIKDTSNYLIRAIYYYDKYYMTVSVDSIRKKDSMNLAALFAKQPAPEKAVNGTKFTKQVVYSMIAQNYTRELDHAALSFLQMTNDPLLLAKAIQWSARANQFFEHYEAMDTHARLLYKTGQKAEAIEWETKAIAAKKNKGFEPKDLEKILSDMKEGKLKVN